MLIPLVQLPCSHGSGSQLSVAATTIQLVQYFIRQCQSITLIYKRHNKTFNHLFLSTNSDTYNVYSKNIQSGETIYGCFDKNDAKIKILLHAENILQREFLNEPSSPSKKAAFNNICRIIQARPQIVQNSWLIQKADDSQGYGDIKWRFIAACSISSMPCMDHNLLEKLINAESTITEETNILYHGQNMTNQS